MCFPENRKSRCQTPLSPQPDTSGSGLSLGETKGWGTPILPSIMCQEAPNVYGDITLILQYI